MNAHSVMAYLEQGVGIQDFSCAVRYHVPPRLRKTGLKHSGGLYIEQSKKLVNYDQALVMFCKGRLREGVLHSREECWLARGWSWCDSDGGRNPP